MFEQFNNLAIVYHMKGVLFVKILFEQVKSHFFFALHLIHKLFGNSYQSDSNFVNSPIKKAKVALNLSNNIYQQASCLDHIEGYDEKIALT
jgi:hypothetical protein